MKAIIRAENLGKRYRIGAREATYGSLRETIANLASAPWMRLKTGRNGASKESTIWALKDVNFTVEPGEVVGIIGRNGAGKSTLLKLLSRITEPTVGRIELYGRIGSLLEVGTGFHPELTGRENIFLNGAIIGMRKSEIRRKFDEIVAFAEVEKFLDTPVKRYSSGMYVRLAFAVAAHLEPEILLVDEVLAVGDVAFQKKCLGKMEGIAAQGRTILFVSHNLAAVQALCSRLILLDQGRIEMDGTSSQVILRYTGESHRRAEQAWQHTNTAPGNGNASLHSVRVLNATGVASEIRTGEDFKIEVTYWIKTDGIKLGATVVLFNHEGTCIFSSISNHEPNWHEKPRPRGLYRSLCHVPRLFLAEGQYSVTILLWEGNYQSVCRLEDVVRFDVIDSGELRGNYFGAWSGVVRPKLEWISEDIKTMETGSGDDKDEHSMVR